MQHGSDYQVTGKLQQFLVILIVFFRIACCNFDHPSQLEPAAN